MTDTNSYSKCYSISYTKSNRSRKYDRITQQQQQQQQVLGSRPYTGASRSVLTSCASQIQNSPKPTRAYASIGFGG